VDDWIDRDLDPFPETYGWILDKESNVFQNWLLNSIEIFWISGKAGAGKSTLMNFLLHHAMTSALLKEWAGEDITIARFFAWSSGSPLERSQDGLLRNLLYQILDKHRELIQQTVPKRCADRSSTSQSWTKTELSAVLSAVVRGDKIASKFCFFTDGLDEFEGEHEDLIDEIVELNMSPAIKICLASIPWPVFRSTFGSGGNDFYLHELTRADIETYIKGRLSEDQRFVELTTRSGGTTDDVGDFITEKAEGSFLWARLVVNSLRKGLQNSDSMNMLIESTYCHGK
jgi:hypothetical protein